MYILDFKIRKKDYLRITQIVKELSRLSELEEIQELDFLWYNVVKRNLYGYELDRQQFELRKLREL